MNYANDVTSYAQFAFFRVIGDLLPKSSDFLRRLLYSLTLYFSTSLNQGLMLSHRCKDASSADAPLESKKYQNLSFILCSN